MRRSLYGALMLPLLAGCYEYQVIQPGAAPEGMDVRARVSASRPNL